jgi:hypothetical protein
VFAYPEQQQLLLLLPPLVCLSHIRNISVITKLHLSQLKGCAGTELVTKRMQVEQRLFVADCLLLTSGPQVGFRSANQQKKKKKS